MRPKPLKKKFSDIFLKKLKPQPSTFVVWDEYQRGLGVRVQPTGSKTFKVVYSFHSRPRWYHIGAVDAISLTDARKLASEVMYKVAQGQDPCAERRAQRSQGTFEELATRYLEEYAKKKNKSWKQAEALVRRNLIPKWGKLQAADISRSDVKGMMARIEAPIVANQTLAAASAIFSWGIREDILKTNPCQKVERNVTNERERVLSDSEIPKFWAAFDDAGLVESLALKLILLAGQRPGEVRAMHRKHIVDGFWQLPGSPDPKLGWPGTKNGESHRIWLSKPALAVIEQLDGDAGFVFAGPRGKAMNKGQLPKAMRAISKKLSVAPVTPHDLRRTFSTKVTGLGFGRDALNRVTNHKDGGIASVYDRHGYAEENKKIMAAVAAEIMRLVEGRDESNVIEGQFGR